MYVGFFCEIEVVIVLISILFLGGKMFEGFSKLLKFKLMNYGFEDRLVNLSGQWPYCEHCDIGQMVNR